MRLDLVLFNALHRFWGANRFLDAVGVFLANTLPYLLAAGALVFIFTADQSDAERFVLAGEMFLAFVLARGIVAGSLGALLQRARPFVALRFTPPFFPMTQGSLPSGHMSGLFSVVLVMFAVDARWGLAYILLSLLVGIARVYTGVHWPSDILAGILVGLAGGFAIHVLIGLYGPAWFANPDAAVRDSSLGGT